MSVTGKRRFKSVIEQVITSKPALVAISADTIRSDAAAILESLLAEYDESAVLAALAHQGFDAEAYRFTARALANVARERRPLRKAGSENKRDAGSGKDQ